MNRIFNILMLAAAAFAAAACASKQVEEVKGVLPEPTSVVLLYPEGQNVDKGIVEDGVTVTLGPVVSNGCEGPEGISEKSGNINHVGDSARIELYIPEHPNGQMVIICPGGGYTNLAMRHEGAYPAKWLNERGIAAAVLVYRMPRKVYHEAPVSDVRNAFRYCRYHSAEWGVKQIGVMGFSAGGHLAAVASTLFTDEITRPDFSILVYPVITFDPEIKKKSSPAQMADDGRRADLLELYSAEKQVTANTPPAIVLQCADDKGCTPEHGYRYLKAMTANGVQCELHVFPYGGHGWGWKTEENGYEEKLTAGLRDEFFHCVENFLSRQALTIQ